jgi:hypothetical protein
MIAAGDSQFQAYASAEIPAVPTAGGHLAYKRGGVEYSADGFKAVVVAGRCEVSVIGVHAQFSLWHRTEDSGVIACFTNAPTQPVLVASAS